MSMVKLYDYQLDAINKLHSGNILCGGVGSGKSLTALGYYYLQNGGSEGFLRGGEYQEMSQNGMNLYIITTARKRDTYEWDSELCKFYLSTNPDASYGDTLIFVDSWNNIKKYVDVTNAFFIFDEQRVVGSGAWVKSFLKITKSNKWILLSATPGDSWQDYIPVFIANGFYKNRTEFIREHIVYSRFSKYPKVDRYINVRRLERLRNKILINMDYEKHTESHHIDIYVDYNKAAYKEVGKTRWDPYKNEPIQNAAGLCYIWRKIVNGDDSRFTALFELFNEHPRMIVFYNFDYELERIKTLELWYTDTDIFEIAEWNGHKHQPIPDTEKWLYLVQYNAGSEGWNCIKTDTVVFYSQNYSYKTMEQAAGRIDRLTTPYTDLYYYHLKSYAPIDRAISSALKEKKKFNEYAFVKW